MISLSHSAGTYNPKNPKHIYFGISLVPVASYYLQNIRYRSHHMCLGWIISDGFELVCLSVLLLLCPHLARHLTWMKVLCAVMATHGDSRSSYGLLHLRRALKTLVRKCIACRMDTNQVLFQRTAFQSNNLQSMR